MGDDGESANAKWVSLRDVGPPGGVQGGHQDDRLRHLPADDPPALPVAPPPALPRAGARLRHRRLRRRPQRLGTPLPRPQLRHAPPHGTAGRGRLAGRVKRGFFESWASPKSLATKELWSVGSTLIL